MDTDSNCKADCLAHHRRPRVGSRSGLCGFLQRHHRSTGLCRNQFHDHVLWIGLPVWFDLYTTIYCSSGLVDISIGRSIRPGLAGQYHAHWRLHGPVSDRYVWALAHGGACSSHNRSWDLCLCFMVVFSLFAVDNTKLLQEL